MQQVKIKAPIVSKYTVCYLLIKYSIKVAMKFCFEYEIPPT